MAFPVEYFWLPEDDESVKYTRDPDIIRAQSLPETPVAGLNLNVMFARLVDKCSNLEEVFQLLVTQINLLLQRWSAVYLTTPEARLLRDKYLLIFGERNVWTQKRWGYDEVSRLRAVIPRSISAKTFGGNPKFDTLKRLYGAVVVDGGLYGESILYADSTDNNREILDEMGLFHEPFWDVHHQAAVTISTWILSLMIKPLAALGITGAKFAGQSLSKAKTASYRDDVTDMLEELISADIGSADSIIQSDETRRMISLIAKGLSTNDSSYTRQASGIYS